MDFNHDGEVLIRTAFKAADLPQEGDKFVDPVILAHRAEDEGPVTAAGQSVGAHLLEIDLDMWCQLDLVDHQHV